MFKATGVPEKSLSGIFLRLREDWEIVISHTAQNTTKASAHFYKYNTQSLPPRAAVEWEIKELETTIERRNDKQNKAKKRLAALRLMLENEKGLN